jgi:hypothetical protein
VIVTGSSYSVSNIGDDNFAIQSFISISQNGSVQKAERYLSDKSSEGSSTAQSSGNIQSSITSFSTLSKHPVIKMLQVSKERKSQIFFIVIYFVINTICSISI